MILCDEQKYVIIIMMMLIHILISIVLLTILGHYIYRYSNTTERFITRKRGIEKLKRRIDKIAKLSFEKKRYKSVAKYIFKMKDKKATIVLLDIIYNHYKNHEDKEGFKSYILEKTSLMNENDNIDCKLFKKCDSSSNVCGSLLTNITKTMKETENCAHYKSVLGDIKQLVNEKSESSEE
jgi:glutamyl/glutaminyl-tRNA synthetase